MRTEPITEAHEGMILREKRTGPLDPLAFARISVALDDPNLVHLDEAVAREAGFDGVIGSGGIVIGLLYEVVRQWAGTGRVISGETRQLVPFPVNTAFVASGLVREIANEENGERVAVCDVQVRDGDGTEVGRGTFRARL